MGLKQISVTVIAFCGFLLLLQELIMHSLVVCVSLNYGRC